MAKLSIIGKYKDSKGRVYKIEEEILNPIIGNSYWYHIYDEYGTRLYKDFRSASSGVDYLEGMVGNLRRE